ncbi:MAG: hypothetical protein ACR2MD_06160 [Aridibacter sp.]
MFSANIAVAEGSQDVSPIGKKQNDKTNLIVLKGGFSTEDNSYKFELNSNGTGKIFYSDFLEDSEDFLHEADVKALAEEIEKSVKAEISSRSEQNMLEDSEIESIREETVSEMLEEFFWEEINQTLEDPFFRSFYNDSDWGEDLTCELGTAAEFEEFLELCVLTEREITSPDDYLLVEAETEYEEAGLSDCSYHTERLEELVNIACQYFKPTGFRYDYNDGCYDRFSGYSMSSESVCISFEECSKIPAREKMNGMIKLKEKLAEMEVPSEMIERITVF